MASQRGPAAPHGNGAERRGGAADGVAAGDADAPLSKIERQDDPRRRGGPRAGRSARSAAPQALPLIGLMRDSSTPSRRPAACQRDSNGTSKMRPESTGALSQAFARISSSSCPPSQPA